MLQSCQIWSPCLQISIQARRDFPRTWSRFNCQKTGLSCPPTGLQKKSTHFLSCDFWIYNYNASVVTGRGVFSKEDENIFIFKTHYVWQCMYVLPWRFDNVCMVMYLGWQDTLHILNSEIPTCICTYTSTSSWHKGHLNSLFFRR
jgi:hypothetical protein